MDASPACAARSKNILSGSQKLELMKGMSESLAGRVSITELSGLSLREIHGIKFNQHFVPTDEYLKEREQELKTYDHLWETIHKGSYPELYDVERDWQEYYSSYVSTYLERDINELISTDSLTFTKIRTTFVIPIRLTIKGAIKEEATPNLS